MKVTINSNSNTSGFGVFPIIFVVTSLAAIASSFVLANSIQDYGMKSRGFSAIIVIYLSACFVIHFLSSKAAGKRVAATSTEGEGARIDEHLKGIEEAGEVFSGSLKSGDVFRLVSSRANQVLPFTASALFVVDKTVRSFKTVHAHGDNAERLTGLEIPLDAGLAGRCYESQMVQIGITPLVLSSLSFERSLSNALTDPVTHLPNERAFHLILENQIAESQRNPEDRPLTILAIDIREFDQLNLKFGHVAGDRILSLVANTVKSQLRQMDFFARAANDEFLAILPTANVAVAEEVISRINTSLFTTTFYVSDSDSISPVLNFGVASFGTDGETSDLLILAARLRKEQAKASGPRNVLWFPKEAVN